MYYGKDVFFEKVMEWIVEKLLLPFFIIIITIFSFGGLAWLMFEIFQYINNPVKYIDLPANQLACSQTIELCRPPYSCGSKIQWTKQVNADK